MRAESELEEEILLACLSCSNRAGKAGVQLHAAESPEDGLLLVCGPAHSHRRSEKVAAQPWCSSCHQVLKLDPSQIGIFLMNVMASHRCELKIY